MDSSRRRPRAQRRRVKRRDATTDRSIHPSIHRSRARHVDLKHTHTHVYTYSHRPSSPRRRASPTCPVPSRPVTVRLSRSPFHHVARRGRATPRARHRQPRRPREHVRCRRFERGASRIVPRARVPAPIASPRAEKSLRESQRRARARASVRDSRRRRRLTNARVSFVARSVSKNLPTTSSS